MYQDHNDNNNKLGTLHKLPSKTKQVRSDSTPRVNIWFMITDWSIIVYIHWAHYIIIGILIFKHNVNTWYILGGEWCHVPGRHYALELCIMADGCICDPINITVAVQCMMSR